MRMNLARNETSTSLSVTQGINQDYKNSFSIKGQSDHCDALISQRGHVLVGVSPFNSRFSKNYVEALLMWAHYNFSKVDILLPDEEHASMLLCATDLPIGKSLRKTRKEINRHRRVLLQCLDNIGESATETKILDFSSYSSHPSYRALRDSVINAYENCEKFRQACTEMSSQAVLGRCIGVGEFKNYKDLDQSKICKATPYIFAEMPFYLNTPSFLNLDSSVLVYHRAWPIGGALLSGEFPIYVNSKQGHGIVSESSRHHILEGEQNSRLIKIERIFNS